MIYIRIKILHPGTLFVENNYQFNELLVYS